jgi:hypothetical protein
VVQNGWEKPAHRWHKEAGKGRRQLAIVTKLLDLRLQNGHFEKVRGYEYLWHKF